MKKRVAACMTAACLAATTVGMTVGLTGCGGGGGSKFPTKESDPTADISVMLYANSTETEFYNKYFAEKEKEYGIKISFEGNQDYDKLLDPRMQSGNPPDIFYVKPNQILKYKDDIFCLEQFKDTVATNEKLNLNLSKIYPLALNLYKYNDKTNEMDAENGELYAFPKDLSTQQLGYYKPIVEKSTTQIHAAGLPLPWELGKGAYENKKNYTWDEYHQMCEIIADEGAKANPVYYGCDIPDIEILAKSFGGSILNTETMKADVTSQAVTKAIEYQRKLVTPREGHQAAADFDNATQQNFQGQKVAFYGAVASWEVGDYDDALGIGNWGVMAWPTEDGSENWYGTITSAGYVVSNQCKNWQVAMELAASFMTTKVQDRMSKDEKISIPLNMDLKINYLDSANDSIYSPSTRSIFMDVISGEHGFIPAVYYTFAEDWLDPLSTQLQIMWKGKGKGGTINASTQSDMQNTLDGYKNMY